MPQRLETVIAQSRKLDHIEKMCGSFLIESTPNMMTTVPKFVEEGWVGLALPIRYPDIIELGSVLVEHSDIIASSLSQGREDIADYFDLRSLDFTDEYRPQYSFFPTAGKVAIDSTFSTDTFYNYLSRKNR